MQIINFQNFSKVGSLKQHKNINFLGIILFSLILPQIIKCCKIGCNQCNEMLECSTCEQGFLLDKIQKICVYKGCENGLFFQQRDLKIISNQNKKECVAICDNGFYQFPQQNMCISFDQCSLDYRTKANLNGGDPITQIYDYQEQYILIIHGVYLVQMDRTNGQFVQMLEYGDDIKDLYKFGQYIIIVSANRISVNLFDIQINKRTNIMNVMTYGILPDAIYLMNLNDGYIISLSIYKEEKAFLVQLLFKLDDISHPFNTGSGILYHFNYNKNDVQCYKNIIIFNKDDEFIITNIYVKSLKIILSRHQKPFVCQTRKDIFMVERIERKEQYIVIHNNDKKIVIFDNSSCFFKEFDSIVLKFIVINTIEQDYFVILLQNYFLFLDQEFNTVFESQFKKKSDLAIDLITSQVFQNEQIKIFTLIKDIETTKFYVSFNMVNIKDSKIKITNTKIYDIDISDPKRLEYLEQTTVNQYSPRLYAFGSDFISIQLGDNIKNEKQEYLIENFELNQFVLNKEVLSILFIEKSNTVLSCYKDGYIAQWDASNVFDSTLIDIIKISKDSCISMNTFDTNNQQKVLILFQSKLILYDIFKVNSTKEWSFTKNINPSQLSIYDQTAIILFDNKLYYLKEQLYNLQNIEFSDIGNIVNISYQAKNIIILQISINILGIYQIKFENNSIINIKQKQFDKTQISLFKIKNFSESYQQKSMQQFEIILYLYNNTVIFMNQDLIVHSLITDIPLSGEKIEINFIQNDPDDMIYFIAGKTNKISTYPYEVYCLMKDTKTFASAFQMSLLNELFVPKKYYDELSEGYVYDVSMLQNLGSLSTIGTFTYEAKKKTGFYKNIQLMQDLGFVRTTTSPDYQYMIQGDSLGNVQAKLFALNSYQKVYELPQNQQIEKDYIIDIQQSYVLNRYFIIKRSVLIFSIHTNILEKELVFENYLNDPIIKFNFIENSRQIIICKAFLIRVYDIENEYKYIEFQSNTPILNFMYIQITYSNKSEQNLYVLGETYRVFNLQLQLIKELDFQAKILSCIGNSYNIFCRLSDYRVQIVDYFYKQNRPLRPKVLNSDFLQIIDFQFTVNETKDRIFIFYPFEIHLYTYLGSFKQKVYQSSRQIVGLQTYGNIIVVQTKTTTKKINWDFKKFYLQFLIQTKKALVFIDQDTLQTLNELSPAGSGTILKVIYVEEYNHLILCTDVIRFAQIFIFSLDSMNLIQSLKNIYTQNDPTVVVDIMYDRYMNVISFIDVLGNLIFFDYGGSFPLLNNQKIREFLYNPTFLTLGMNLNVDLNNLIVYSKTQVYQSNYAEYTNRYIQYQIKKNNFFVQLNNSKFKSQYEMFLILSNNNRIFLYYNFKFFYFSKLKNTVETIKDIQYNSDANYIILAFSHKIQLYDASYSQNQLSENMRNQFTKNEINDYSFSHFLCENVFLTLNQTIVHYQFDINEFKNKYELKESQRVVSFQYLQQIKLLVIGFNDGQILLYNTISLEISKIYLITDRQQDSARYIVETENYIWIATISSQVVQINKQNIKEQTKYNFRDLTQTPKKLSVFNVDEKSDNKNNNQFNRMFLSYSGEKIMNCMKLNQLNKKEIIYISFPNTTLNKILIGETLIIFYSTFQLNIHQRNDLTFIFSIRRQNLQDEIKDVRIIKDQFYFITFTQKIELIYVNLNSKNITLIDQIKVKQFRIIKMTFDEKQVSLRIIGVSQNQLYDQKYSLVNYMSSPLQGYNLCSLDVITSNQLEMAKIINLIKPLYQQIPTMLSLITLSNQSQNRYLSVYLQRNDLDEINFAATKDSQITIIPMLEDRQQLFKSQQKKQQQQQLYFSSNQQLLMTKKTFQYFLKKDILLKNLIFQFPDGLTDQKIIFSDKTKNIYLQEIQVQNQNLQDISFSFQDMDFIAIIDFKVQNVNLSYSSTQSFLTFNNCKIIKFIDITISDVIFQGTKNQFIDVFDSQSVLIDNITIMNSKLDFFSLFKKIEKFKIQNISIRNCTSYSKNQQNSIYIFKSLRTLELEVQNINMVDNTNIQFISTINTFKVNNQTITLNNDTINITNGNFLNNQITNSNSFNIFSLFNTYSSITKLIFYQNQGNIHIQEADEVKIIDCDFQKNTNLNGGAISFTSIMQLVSIKNSNFTENSAFGCGGALYFEIFMKTVKIENSVIAFNSALIGGGIHFYYGFSISERKQFEDLTKNKNVYGNIATLYGQDFGYGLSQLQVIQVIEDPSESKTIYDFNYIPESQLNNEENKNYSGKLILQNVRSGTQFQIQIQALDFKGDILQFSLEKYIKNYYPRQIQQELSQISFKLEIRDDKGNTVLNGETLITSDQYNETKQSFGFREFQVTAKPNSQVEFLLNYQINYGQSKPILVILNFRSCLEGEVIKQFGPNIISCFKCMEGTYSMVKPQLSNKTQALEESTNQCQKCPDSADFCKGNKILIKDGYWRGNTDSSEILYCYNQPKNCKAQSADSINGCIKGNIGPLCEECDSFTDSWKNKQYSYSFTSPFQCAECSPLSYQITFIVIMLMCFVVYVMGSTFMFMTSFMYTQTCYYLRRLSIFPISRNSVLDQSSFYLKILLNYMQLMTYLIFFKVNIFPDFISDCFNIIQSPAQKINVTIDCAISQLVKSRIERTHALQVIQFLTPIFQYISARLIFVIFEKLNLYQTKSSHQFTLLNFIFVFFQPSQIIYFTQSLSCRQIGSKSYLTVDLLIPCHDSQYERFSIPFAISIILFWILTPLWILRNLKQKSHILNYCTVRYKYGYYYSEFKSEYYFWEFIRLNLRVAIVMIFTLLRHNIQLVYLLIVFIISVYIKTLLVYKPIYSIKILKFEIMANCVIIVNIILTAINNIYEDKGLETLTYVIHLTFMVYIISVIISQKAYSRFNILGKGIRWILQKVLSQNMYRKFEQKNKIQMKSYNRWKFIRSVLLQIIGMNALQKAKKNPTNLIMNEKQEKLQFQMSALVAELSKSYSPQPQRTNTRNEEDIIRSRFNTNKNSEIAELEEYSQIKLQKVERNEDSIKKDQVNFTLNETKIGFYTEIPNSDKNIDLSSIDISPSIHLKDRNQQQRNNLPYQYKTEFILKTQLDQQQSNNFIE